jgi:hypothetical protein
MERNRVNFTIRKQKLPFLLFRPVFFEVSSIHADFICVKYWISGSYAVPNIHEMEG